MLYEDRFLKEAKEKPGFYEVPDVYPVALSKTGEVYSLHTKNIIKCHTSTYGYIVFEINYNGVAVKHRLHRLLAKTFIGKPDHLWSVPYDELVVNHMDGIKNNNALSNLEWCTNQENSIHAVNTGLCGDYDTVLSKDIRYGTVKKYLNAATCARAFGLTEFSLRNHLQSLNYGTKLKTFHVFKYDNEKPWPVLKDIDLTKNYNDFAHRGYWIGTELATGNKILGDTQIRLCEKIGIKFTSSNWIYKHDKINNDCFGWNIQYKDRMTEDELKLIPIKAPTNNGGSKVKLINTITGEEKIFDSKLKMSRETNIKIGTIDYYISKDRLLNGLYKIQVL